MYHIPNHLFLPFSVLFFNFYGLPLEKKRIGDIQYLRGESIFWFVPLSFPVDPMILQWQRFWHTTANPVN